MCVRGLEAIKKTRNENEMLENWAPKDAEWAAYKQQQHLRGASLIGYDSEEDYISGDDYYDDDDEEGWTKMSFWKRSLMRGTRI